MPSALRPRRRGAHACRGGSDCAAGAPGSRRRPPDRRGRDRWHGRVAWHRCGRSDGSGRRIGAGGIIRACYYDRVRPRAGCPAKAANAAVRPVHAAAAVRPVHAAAAVRPNPAAVRRRCRPPRRMPARPRARRTAGLATGAPPDAGSIRKVPASRGPGGTMSRQIAMDDGKSYSAAKSCTPAAALRQIEGGKGGERRPRIERGRPAQATLIRPAH